MGLSEKYINVIEHPTVEATINFIKKFKSSKSYWSVSYFILLFTIREAIAWKFGSAIKTFCETQAVDSSFPMVWSVLGFVFDVGGSIELVLLGTFVFVVLSLVKVSESEGSGNGGSYYGLVLFSLIGLSLSPLYYFYEGDRIEEVVKKESESIKEEVLKNNEKLDILKEQNDEMTRLIKGEKNKRINPSQFYSVSGNIINLDTRDPLSIVKVSYGNLETYSKEDGTFILKDIPNRKDIQLYFSKDGYDDKLKQCIFERICYVSMEED